MVSIVGPLKERQLKGVLVDSYVAEEMKEFSSEELRVNKIIDHNTMELYLEREDCQKRLFRTALRTEIFEIVKANTSQVR